MSGNMKPFFFRLFVFDKLQPHFSSSIAAETRSKVRGKTTSEINESQANLFILQ